jgi:hypothetical protein
MAKLNGKPVWIVMNPLPGYQLKDLTIRATYGAALITFGQNFPRKLQTTLAFYDDEKEAKAEAKKRWDKVKSKQASRPDYDYDRQS